jgi:hypothetical protein
MGHLPLREVEMGIRGGTKVDNGNARSKQTNENYRSQYFIARCAGVRNSTEHLVFRGIKFCICFFGVSETFRREIKKKSDCYW